MGKYFLTLISNVGNTFGQLGIAPEDKEGSYTTPRLCSFNIIIKSISCGDDHTILITRIVCFKLR